MGFLSATAAKVVSGNTSTGGYLSASKLGDGDSMRFAILSEEPLEYFTVWGENNEMQKRPFRFTAEPTPSDIKAELGEYNQKMNFEGTALEKPKFAASFFVFDYTSEEVKLLEIPQKGLLKELWALSQSEDYANLQDWDLTISRTGMKLNTEYRLVPGPRKKGMQPAIDEAWAGAQAKGYDLHQLLTGGNPFGDNS